MFGWIFSPSRLSTSIEFYAHRAQQLAAWLRFAEEVAQIEFVGVPDLVKPAALGAYYWWRRYQPFASVHHAEVCGLELAFVRDDEGSLITRRSSLSKARDTSSKPDEYSAPELGKWEVETLGFHVEDHPGFTLEFARLVIQCEPSREAPFYKEHQGYGYFGWVEDGFVRIADRAWLLEHVGFEDWVMTVSREEE